MEFSIIYCWIVCGGDLIMKVERGGILEELLLRVQEREKMSFSYDLDAPR